jgi:20S proteasome subunit alpha 5
MSGLIADSRTMVNKARIEAQVSGYVHCHMAFGPNCITYTSQNYWFTFNEPMSVESVIQGVSNLALSFSRDQDDDDVGMVSCMWTDVAHLQCPIGCGSLTSCAVVKTLIV